MKYLSALVSLLLTTALPSAQEQQYDMKLIQLVLLRDAQQPPKIADSKREELFSKHLSHVESLWKRRTALMAGPFEHAEPLRGLVLLDVKTAEEAMAIMASDPLVEAKLLELEIKPWFVARNVPQQGPNFTDMEPMWFGFLKRPSNAPTYSEDESKQIQAGHMANIEKMAASGKLVLAGPMGGDGALRGIFIFRGDSKESIMAMAADDPAIQKGRLELELREWFVTRGTFPSMKREAKPRFPGGPTEAELRAMKKLDYLVGTWEGKGWFMDREGKKHTFTGKETVQSKLHGRTLLVEGLFHADEDGKKGEVMHETLAILSSDSKGEKFSTRAHLFNGPTGDHALDLTPDGWSWNLKPPGGPTIKYTATFKDGVWTEFGEVEVGGRRHRFFEMVLKKRS